MDDNKKLIRDNIPSILQSENKQIKTHKASGNELEFYIKDLLEKSCRSFINAREMNTQIESLADIKEVLEKIYSFYHIPYYEVMMAQEKKAVREGKFNNDLIGEF